MHAYNRMCVCVYIRMCVCTRIRMSHVALSPYLVVSLICACLCIYETARERESERARELENERAGERESESSSERTTERASKRESESERARARASMSGWSHVIDACDYMPL
jgi:hypothetical protein